MSMTCPETDTSTARIMRVADSSELTSAFMEESNALVLETNRASGGDGGPSQHDTRSVIRSTLSEPQPVCHHDTLPAEYGSSPYWPSIPRSRTSPVDGPGPTGS